MAEITKIPLARFEKVELRDVWESESGSFTPWLAQKENLKLLGDTIGFDLELEAQEKNVGPFRADILCKDTTTSQWVLIENQLEKTDHTHLGQLLTYAAGLDVVTIVWIAAKFTDEHRAALDWLNEITDERFNFFGLEVELWKIGKSDVAPKFNIACEPNNWIREVVEGASRVTNEGLSDVKKLQLEFWTEFRKFLTEQDNSPVKPVKPQPQHWMDFSIGRSGFNLAAIASVYDNEAESYDSHEIRVEFILKSNDAKAQFNKLTISKDEIEKIVGNELTWRNPETAKMCRVYIRKSVNLNNRDDWRNQHEWLYKQLGIFKKVFGARVNDL
jgi:hypothetical protein